ncbi:hypothetical protein AUL54_00220 [Bacillus sp. SDLI1]|nr:hypothetical protein AUL54_00220 [Bacillus sp. SDLI1]
MSRGFNYVTTLGACWSKKDNDWRIYYPRKQDGWELHDFLKTEAFNNFIQDLKQRGYDTKTLRLSVKKRNGETE